MGPFQSCPLLIIRSSVNVTSSQYSAALSSGRRTLVGILWKSTFSQVFEHCRKLETEWVSNPIPSFPKLHMHFPVSFMPSFD